MVKIEFLGPINKEPLNADIDSLEQLSEILKNEEGVSSWLENSAVAVNDTLVQDRSMKLKDGDKVSLLPPVCGG